MRFHYRDIGGSDGITSVQVFAEVRAADRLPYLRFRLADVARVNESVARRVANQAAHVSPMICSLAFILNPSFSWLVCI
jgi:hypothetical protein